MSLPPDTDAVLGRLAHARRDELAHYLASIVEFCDDAILTIDLDGTITSWNKAAERLYGYTVEEAIGKPITMLTPPNRYDEGPAILERIKRGERVEHYDTLLKRRQGTLINVSLTVSPVRNAQGKIIGASKVSQEITERKKIEADLRETEQQLRWLASIVQSSDDAIVSKNLDGIISSWNKGAERVFGYTAEEAVGQPITIVIPQDRQHEELTILTRIRRGERIEHFETVRQRKHGSLIWVSLTISPVKNAEGKIVGASKIARDITEQKRTGDQLTTLAREAEHRSKNLLANVQAMVNLSQADAVADLKKAIEGRIQALANVHSLFVATRWIGAELSTIAEQELTPYSTSGEKRLRIDGPQVLLEPTTAQAVAVTLHELATNAAKYGALSTADGHVELKWFQEASGPLNLRWIETGGPTVQPPTRRGFGGRIIEQMIGQLKGESRFDWRAEGLVCEITIPV